MERLPVCSNHWCILINKMPEQNTGGVFGEAAWWFRGVVLSSEDSRVVDLFSVCDFYC